jgi:hypothetical protein
MWLPRPLEQVCANCLEAMAASHAGVRFEAGEEVETSLRTMNHRHRHRSVQTHHRVIRGALEEIVERENLRPIGGFIGRRFVVESGDGCL